MLQWLKFLNLDKLNFKWAFPARGTLESEHQAVLQNNPK